MLFSKIAMSMCASLALGQDAPLVPAAAVVATDTPFFGRPAGGDVDAVRPGPAEEVALEEAAKLASIAKNRLKIGLRGADGVTPHFVEADSQETPFSLMVMSKSYRVDKDQPMFLNTGVELFSLTEEDIQSLPYNTMTSNEITSETSSELSRELSESFGVSAGFGGFEAAASFSNSDLNRNKKYITRVDKYIKANKQKLLLNVPFNLHEKLSPEAKNYLMTRTPREIYDKFGAYYADQITIGGIFQETSVYEMMEDETAASIKSAIALKLPKFGTQAKFEYETSARTACANTHIQRKVLGGHSTIWLEGGEASVLQAKWAQTVNDGNYFPTDYNLQPIFKLLEHQEMSFTKAAELKKYLEEDWAKEKSGDEGVYEYIKSKKPVTGYVTITQPISAVEQSKQSGYIDHGLTKKASELLDGGVKKHRCWNLDDLICEDNTKCLKWGYHCYAGTISMPEGVTVTTYKNFKSCDDSEKLNNYESKHGQELFSFWNFDKRVCQFLFGVATGYTDSGEEECL